MSVVNSEPAPGCEVHTTPQELATELALLTEVDWRKVWPGAGRGHEPDPAWLAQFNWQVVNFQWRGNTSHHCIHHTTGVCGWTHHQKPKGKYESAKCRGASLSYSKHAQGTCSHQRGVRYWFKWAVRCHGIGEAPVPDSSGGRRVRGGERQGCA
ncbi:hypothetical protein [Streptomyces sp. NPDC005476]|uniref:hypothetical protein n=1 Tax=Streptomyces sp. NPDC005476 TaxID=3156882 RepID=UPI0034567497